MNKALVAMNPIIKLDLTGTSETPWRNEVMRDEKAIAELAYQLWRTNGRPAGSANADWYEAERVLKREKSSGPAESSAPTPVSIDSGSSDAPPGNHSQAGITVDASAASASVEVDTIDQTDLSRAK